MKLKNVLVALAVMGAAATAFGWPDPPPPEEPPPPPPPVNDCTPGFWKNHLEVWAGFCLVDPATCVSLVVADLTSRGPGSDALRHDAAAALNTWADTAYPEKVCTD